jgi:hypothetical protein
VNTAQIEVVTSHTLPDRVTGKDGTHRSTPHHPVKSKAGAARTIVRRRGQRPAVFPVRAQMLVQEAIFPTCELFPAARAGTPPLVLHTRHSGFLTFQG